MTTLLDFFESTRLDETELLQRRMVALGLDVEAWAYFEPVMLGELQGLCAACVSRQRCAYDLVTHFDDPTWPDGRHYCPNAAKLDNAERPAKLPEIRPHDRASGWAVRRSSASSAGRDGLSGGGNGVIAYNAAAIDSAASASTKRVSPCVLVICTTQRLAITSDAIGSPAST